MLNFQEMNKKYRERIRWGVGDIMDRVIIDYLLKGGDFNAAKITKMFNTASRTAQLITDLEIGTGLCPLEEEKDGENDKETYTTGEDQTGPISNPLLGGEVSDLGEGNPEGPTGSFGSEGRVRDPNGAANQADDNRAAGSGEVNPPQ